MSRVGKVFITIPKGVDVKVAGKIVTVKGPKGQLQQEVSPDVTVKVEDGNVLFTPVLNNQETKSKWGLYRMLVYNMIVGVTTGYSKELEVVGVGYKIELKGKAITIAAGYSHPVVIQPKNGVTFTVPAPTKVIVSGIDKQAVGQSAAEIHNVRPPEPYKGKGVRFVGEVIRKKAGKAAGAAAK